MKWLTLKMQCYWLCSHDGKDFFFSPSSVQPTQWSSDLNDQKWVWRKTVCFLLCMWTDTWMRWGFFFLLLQLWWHRTGDPELRNSATWAAVPEGTTAGLQLCEFTLKHPPTWIKQSVWFCLPRRTELKFIYIKSPEASYILHPISLFCFLDILFFLFAVNSWALVISVLMLISQTAHLLALLAKQPVEIVAIFRTNVRWHRTDYRVNHVLIEGRLPVHVVLLLVFHMHFLISFFRPHCWYLLCRSRWTAAYVMRLCCWRFLVCLVTAWCLLALARWTATTMTSGASATQQAMAWSGQSAVHFFSFLFCLFWPASGQTSCLPHPRLSPQGPEGRYAAPTAGLPSTQGLSEQRHGGCSRGTSCTLHGEKGTEVENTKPLPTLLTTTHWHFSWKWVGSAGVFHL